MTTRHPCAARTPDFPFAEQAALLLLRARYRQSRDLFSPHELAHLRFLRWLFHTEKGSESR